MKHDDGKLKSFFHGWAHLAFVSLLAFVLVLGSGFAKRAEAAFDQLDDFAGLANGTQPTFGNWTGVNGSDGTNGWVVLSGSTGSSNTGPAAGNPDPYVYLESSATGQTYGVGVTAGSSQYIESNVLDASTNNITFTFDYDMNVNTNTDASLHVDAWNGSSWDLDVTGGAVATGNQGDVWTTVGPIDLSSYSNANFKVRIRFIVGSTGTIYNNDVAVDNLHLVGTAKDSTPPTAGTVTVTPDSGTYVPAAFSISTSFTDAQSAVSSCQYTTNGSTWSAGTVSGTGPYTCSASVTGATGNLTINMRGTSAGGTTTATALSRTVDATAPTTTATPVAGTYSADQSVTLAASDGSGSGVASTVYCVDTANTCNPTSAYGSVIPVTGTADTDVVKYLRYFSTDAAGNAEAVQSATYNLNQAVAPTVTAFTIPATVGGTFVVSITNFTASDNVGVTGYLITESATAPSAGAAGWSATAPTTYTVAAYGSYTLYAWAKDAAGNVSTATSAPVTVSSCTETGSVTLDALPNPIAGPIAVTASVSGGASNPEVSFDGGATWQASGSTYTPSSQLHATAQFMARATGSCGGTILDPASPTTVNIDSRTLALEAQSATASQSGLTSILVSMIYCGDQNGTATFQVDYKLSTSGTWTLGTATKDTSNDGSYTLTLSGLTSGATYDVRMTYADPTDGTTAASSPLVQTATVTLVAWTDSPMLHNALRFACSTPGYSDQASCTAAGGTWNLDRKYVGGWGTDTGTYGPIQCGTCHAKNSGNIKRITSAVTASSGSFPGGSVSFNSAVDGSSDFGNDSGGHATSTKICEVCHTVTDHHRYDTSGQTDGLTHYNQADCTKCHEHKNGFRASCNACHGNPPLSTGELTATLYPAGSTGSTTQGAHNTHATTQGFVCDTCHSGWMTSGQMPNGGNLNIGLMPSSNAQFNSATATVDGGSYDGRAAGAYTAGAGTSVTNGGAMTCANYCHGYGTPSWTSTAGTVVCGSCHGQVGGFGAGDVRNGAPDGNVYPGAMGGKDLSGAQSGTKVGKHFNHLDNSQALTGDPCLLCHPNGAAHVGGKIDGTVEVQLNTAYAGAGATFTASTHTCSNIACHGDAVWDSASTGGCNFCHGYPPTSAADAANNKHAPGVNPVNHDMLSAGGANVLANHDDCTYCHGYKDNGTGTLTPLTGAQITAMNGDSTVAASLAGYHQDGKVTINMDGNANTADDAEYDPATGGCNNSACHGNDASHEFAVAGGSGNTFQAADIGPGACGTCHDTGANGAPVVNAGSTHVDADGTGGTYAAGTCTDCHSGHYAKAGGVQIPNNATVGISYTKTGHGGIKLGGPGTIATISGKTTEAEICWACHDANGISEWGTNTNPATGNSPYNYGTLSTSNWTTATWSSSRSQYAYKSGAIESTHTANPAVTDPALSGSAYSYTETPNAVADIRCSNCHDVHELAKAPGDLKEGKPYLRGSWMGNPYEEDGAPRLSYTGTDASDTNTYFTSYPVPGRSSGWGGVPRASVKQAKLGGYWIDQNNVTPMSASTTGNGTAAKNPTASWEPVDTNNETGGNATATSPAFAGLCLLCHNGGQATTALQIDNLDQKTGEGLWVGTNGHANAVKGGTGASSPNATNIFNARNGTTTSSQYNPRQHWSGTNQPGDNGDGFRASGYGARYHPYYTSSSRAYGYGADEWGVDTTGATLEHFHNFSCSKCHNPHASRLPKLMITNCLDTVHNTWDSQYQMSSRGSQNTNREIAQWTSAQNCHRYSESNNPNTASPEYRSGRQASSAGAGAGWNKVTPWYQTTNVP